MDVQAARRKAKALIAQATDDAVTQEEARSHALAAAKLIARYELLDELLPNVMGQVMNPEVGEAVGAVVDLVSRFTKSGLAGSVKRAVSSARRAAETTRRPRGDAEEPSAGRRRRHAR
jgi:hypothetical protein